MAVEGVISTFEEGCYELVTKEERTASLEGWDNKRDDIKQKTNEKVISTN